MFKRKAYDKLRDWKNNYAPNYACLLEGARRVGKTTIAEEFAKNEYKSYIKVDFSDLTESMRDIFENIANRDVFFLRLQNETGIQLFERQSVIIFDEIQLYPKARQAIKHLVKDGRYDYIETGSLISIKKNVKDILIPSEEHKINIYPMDYEEFLWANGGNPEILRTGYNSGIQMGNSLNVKLMRDFRIYMAVGGMPQAVDRYLLTNNLECVDEVKREIIELYREDIKKIDQSGRLSEIYASVPSQLALGKKHFVISSATGKRKTNKDDERIYELIDSGMVLPCYNVSRPSLTLAQNKLQEDYKLYLSDVGLFTCLLFNEPNGVGQDIYSKLLSNSLKADLGYLYENVAAQEIAASGRKLYFHTWRKENSTHSYEIDFLILMNKKVVPIEVKSSAVKQHKSMDAFTEKYSDIVGRRILFSQKDVSNDGGLEYKPIYMLPYFLE